MRCKTILLSTLLFAAKKGQLSLALMLNDLSIASYGPDIIWIGRIEDDGDPISFTGPVSPLSHGASRPAGSLASRCHSSAQPPIRGD